MKIITIIKKPVIPCIALMAVIILFVWSCTKVDTEPIVLVPTVTSVSPVSGEIGDEITITGTNFNTAAIYNEVKIGGISTIATFATSTTLKADVPAGAKAGLVDLTVKAYGENTDPLAFTVIWPPPVVNKCVPGYGYPDDEIVIYGENFSSDLEDVTVTFGDIEATVLESANSEIKVKVPAGAATDDVVVTILEQESNAELFFVPVNPATLTYLITTTVDDVEESVTRGDGKVEDGSGDLDMGKFDTGYTPDFGKNIVGIRHRDIAIPQGATIISAYLQFEADADGSDPTEVTIYGEDIGNAEVFDENIAFNVSSRTLTTANVVWNIPPWVDLDRGLDQRSPDIRVIIQEIVDRVDWVSGNAMSFQVHDTGISADPQLGGADGRDANCGTNVGPSLVIMYEL